MGQLIDGIWHTTDSVNAKSDGSFQRPETVFRNWVTPDGNAGPSGQSGFEAAPGRYHLYVSWACPWAHRALIFRKLKKLEDIISVSVVDWFLGEDGWEFSQRDGATPDAVLGARYLRDIYTAADPGFTGRVTVPVLWDRQRATIVSNESAEIVRMLNSAFDAFTDARDDYYPEPLRSKIDAINERVYASVNNGVYRCGFASAQQAYDKAFGELFASLDWLEDVLSTSRYLAGGKITEADWRLFTTLVRFDAVYVGHFKCNLRRIDDYEHLPNYLRELYQMPGIAETVNMHHIRHHYYASHESINPRRIVPGGPLLDFEAPHNRDRLTKTP
ncbi:MAG: glutathione S-transferase family protein [Nitratireductor sp.]|nr:glutathione S-transferase family protein [Nitratireductor sp.]